MAFGFRDMVGDAAWSLLGPIGTMYSVYRIGTREMKDYEQFGKDAYKALYLDSNGQFNPLKAGMHIFSPAMAAYTLWNNTGIEKAPNPYGRPVINTPIPYTSPPVSRPAVGVGPV